MLNPRPESLARTFAAKLRATYHPKLVMIMGAVLILSPEHARVFAAAGWSKARLRSELDALLLIAGASWSAAPAGATRACRPGSPRAGRSQSSCRATWRSCTLAAPP